MLILYVDDHFRKGTGFDWDAASRKRTINTEFRWAEAEQVFFNTPVLMLPDPAHGRAERAITRSGRQSTKVQRR
jgi:uncharacterized protein